MGLLFWVLIWGPYQGSYYIRVHFGVPPLLFGNSHMQLGPALGACSWRCPPCRQVMTPSHYSALETLLAQPKQQSLCYGHRCIGACLAWAQAPKHPSILTGDPRGVLADNEPEDWNKAPFYTRHSYKYAAGSAGSDNLSFENRRLGQNTCS